MDYNFNIFFIFHSGNAGSDRMSRILEHILKQRSFMPIHPAPDGLNVPLAKMEVQGSIPFTPHVMVTPSELKGYLKVGCHIKLTIAGSPLY